MSFPNQSHINRARDALWQQSAVGASLTVGSGFSRNAEKVHPDAHDSPTWYNLVEAMYDQLYPQSDVEYRQYAIIATPEPSSFIRLAQEQVERRFAEPVRKQLQWGVHASTKQPEADIRAFIEKHNQDPKPFKWTKSADDILNAVKRFCHQVNHNYGTNLSST